VIPNGVSLEAFRPRAKGRFALVVGRICPEKAVHVALEAARARGLPLRVAGAVVGYPEHVRYFEEQVRPRLDEERRFLGPLGRAEKARALATATCVVIPSVAPETSSLVAMEALASGTPVVARRVGALPEIVDDGRTGFLVDRDADLGEAMEEAGRLSPDECRRTAERRFDARDMVRGYLALYARLIGRRAARAVGAPPRCSEAACPTGSGCRPREVAPCRRRRGDACAPAAPGEDRVPGGSHMTRFVAAALLVLVAPAARAQNPWDAAKKAAGSSSTATLEKEINKRLLEESRKNQCSFKSGTAQLEKGCDAKAQRLANALVDAKKKLNAAGVKNFKFVASGHTDSSGSPEKNKQLSSERAAVMVKQLVAKGVPANEIESVGMGSERPIVKPDDTPEKKARNRRYEVQVKL
jgi:outer membrane protein OmpA-like peptidoglycan-associated protein